MALIVPIEVGVDHVDPGLHVAGALHSRDSGRCHDDVEPAQLGDSLVEDLLQLGGVAHVHLGGDHALPRLLDELRGLFEIFGRGHRIADRCEILATVDRDDVGALLGQPNRVTAALAASGAGDEGDFSLNSSH